jgi:hypothetical protein
MAPKPDKPMRWRRQPVASTDVPSGYDKLWISYESTDFLPASGLNGNGSLNPTWDEVLWATMTVGKAHRDVLRHGRYSSADLIHRIACMYAYFGIDGTSRMVRSPAFATLDPSEKGIASFYLGMAMAKLYAGKVLGIPWLMHISRYEANWAVSYGVSAKRPDLFGCNAAGEWAVAEAKGRTQVTGALVKQMKAQKSSVATINGAAPAHRYGSTTRFQAGQLTLRVVDPPARRDAQEIPIDPAAWLIDYYTPIVDLIADTDRHVEGPYLLGVTHGYAQNPAHGDQIPEPHAQNLAHGPELRKQSCPHCGVSCRYPHAQDLAHGVELRKWGYPHDVSCRHGRAGQRPEVPIPGCTDSGPCHRPCAIDVRSSGCRLPAVRQGRCQLSEETSSPRPWRVAIERGGPSTGLRTCRTPREARDEPHAS